MPQEMRGPRFLLALESVRCTAAGQSARMATMDIIRMRARRMGITGRIILWAECLSERGLGITGIAAATTGADIMGARDTATGTDGDTVIGAVGIAGTKDVASAATAEMAVFMATATMGSRAAVTAAFTAVEDRAAVEDSTAVKDRTVVEVPAVEVDRMAVVDRTAVAIGNR